MVKLTLPAALVIALLGSNLSAQTQQKPPKSEAASRETGFPQIIAVSQPDSALSVTTSTRWAIPGRPVLDLFVVVKNTSPKSLRGERVGGNAAIEWFQKLLRAKGPEAAPQAALHNGRILLRSSSASAKWEEGYWRGVETIIQRITTAYQKEGEAELEVVLRKPYDASAVRP